VIISYNNSGVILIVIIRVSIIIITGIINIINIIIRIKVYIEGYGIVYKGIRDYRAFNNYKAGYYHD
jgi:hypothetical protein